MAFDPTLPGFSKSTRRWVIARLRANLPQLNQALANDPLTPLGALTDGCVSLAIRNCCRTSHKRH